MQSSSARVVLLLMLVILTGCQLVPQATSVQEGQTWVSIADDVYLNLSASIPYRRALSQEVNAEYGSSEYYLLVGLEITEEQVVMVGYTPLGQELFEIRFADSTISLQNRSSMPEYVPRFMLADMYLTYWPKTFLDENLRNAVAVDQLLEESSGECVDVPCSGSQWRRVRQIVSGDTVLVSIHYTSLEPWQGEALYRHLDRQYSVHVKTLMEEV